MILNCYNDRKYCSSLLHKTIVGKLRNNSDYSYYAPFRDKPNVCIWLSLDKPNSICYYFSMITTYHKT